MNKSTRNLAHWMRRCGLQRPRLGGETLTDMTSSKYHYRLSHVCGHARRRTTHPEALSVHFRLRFPDHQNACHDRPVSPAAFNLQEYS